METLTVTSNQKNRTFTIRKYQDGKCFAKYRTNQFTRPEFELLEHNTTNDWKEFLNTSQEYYPVKKTLYMGSFDTNGDLI